MKEKTKKAPKKQEPQEPQAPKQINYAVVLEPIGVYRNTLEPGEEIRDRDLIHYLLKQGNAESLELVYF